MVAGGRDRSGDPRGRRSPAPATARSARAWTCGPSRTATCRRPRTSAVIAAGFMRLLDGEVTVPGHRRGQRARALAGGFELLLGCDVVVASADAKFGLPEVKRGLVRRRSGSCSSAAGCRSSVALELTLTGDSIDAERAYELGLVNGSSPPTTCSPPRSRSPSGSRPTVRSRVAATKELVRPRRASNRAAAERGSTSGSADRVQQRGRQGRRDGVRREARRRVWQGR